jgi:cysteine desulfurase
MSGNKSLKGGVRQMKQIYFDNAATTPLLPEVRDAMIPFLGEVFGNPSSLHTWGDTARMALDEAREKVAALINADPEEIIFTGSGTESNNLAMKGLAAARQDKGKHIIISDIEHFSVMNPAKTLEKAGYEISFVPVNNTGVVDPAEVKKLIRKDTILVSIMHANNEVGTIEPIKDIARVTKEAGVILHTDAVATAGNIPVDAKDLGVDALSMAANQFYGPKGVGALYVRKGVRIIPQMEGGIQEGGRRSGTENMPAIVGMGKAAEIAKQDIPNRIKKLTPIRDRLLRELPLKIHHVITTGNLQNRLPNNASFCVQFIEGESMLMMLDAKGIGVTSGSACTSKALKASHVLLAMGLDHEISQGSILFSLGLDNRDEDIDYLLESMPPVVEKLRQMSPVYSKYLKTQGGN